MLLPIDGINLLTPEVLADPFPTYAAVRDERPVCPIEPGGFLGISRYHDVVRVLKTPEIFSSAGFRPALEPEWLGHNPSIHNMIVMDPPEHAKNRKLIQHAFSPGILAQVEPRIRAYIEQIADGLPGQGAFDFVSVFSSPVSAGVLSVFIDLDPALHATFRRWTNVLVGVTPVPRNAEHATTTRRTISEIEDFFGKMLAERTLNPSNDIVSHLIQTRIDGEALSEAELMGLLFLMLAAGIETTSNLMSRAILTLAEQPELMDELRATPALIAGFMNEQLRHDAPAHNLCRLTLTDTTVGDIPIAAGTPVLVMLGAANRDPNQFPDPDRFDIHRNAQGLVSFGAGPHFCLGAALARLEFQTAFAALLTRFKRFELLDETVVWQPGLFVRGPLALHVRAVPA